MNLLKYTNTPIHTNKRHNTSFTSSLSISSSFLLFPLSFICHAHIHASTYSSAYTSISHLLIHRAIHPLIHLFIHLPSIYPSIHPSFGSLTHPPMHSLHQYVSNGFGSGVIVQVLGCVPGRGVNKLIQRIC